MESGSAEGGGVSCIVGYGIVAEERVKMYIDDLEEYPCGGVRGRGGKGPKCKSEAADFHYGDQEYIVGTILTVGTIHSPLLLDDHS